MYVRLFLVLQLCILVMQERQEGVKDRGQSAAAVGSLA